MTEDIFDIKPLPKLSKADLKRLRESEVYKFNNISDFKSIRRCYQVAKELVNCLKYFDTRATRFSCVPQSKAMYEKKRAIHIPEEYINFNFENTKIALFRKLKYDAVLGSKYIYSVGVQSPHRFRTLGAVQGKFDFFKDFVFYFESDLFSEAKECFLRTVSEFISDYFENRVLL